MSKVKSKNTGAELKLIKIFKENNIKGWRRTYPMFGKPDFVFLKHRIAIFVDGCFWHGHNCRNVTPKNNAEYWRKKIENNKERDKIVTKTIEKKGWKVIRIWECELKGKAISKKVIELIEILKDLNRNKQ